MAKAYLTETRDSLVTTPTSHQEGPRFEWRSVFFVAFLSSYK